MWREMDPIQMTDVYFVFPNLVVKDKNNCTHYGILLKLCMDVLFHGMELYFVIALRKEIIP